MQYLYSSSGTFKSGTVHLASKKEDAERNPFWELFTSIFVLDGDISLIFNFLLQRSNTSFRKFALSSEMTNLSFVDRMHIKISSLCWRCRLEKETKPSLILVLI